MKVLFSSLAGHGHVYPLLPLARALRDRGDEVAYATAEKFHPTLAGCGFEPVAAGMDMLAAFGGAGAELGIDPSQLRERHDSPEMQRLISHVFNSVLPRAFATDVAAAIDRLRPDLVVYEAANPGAAIAAKAAGVPAICHGFGRGGDLDLVADLMENLTRVAAEHGVDLDPVDDFDLGDPYLDIYPPSIQHPPFLDKPHRVPLRPVPFAEPGELPDWVAGHREPLVYLTLGTAFGHAGLLGEAIAGLTTLPFRVLVAAGPSVDVDAIGAVPDRVTVLPWVPQADLLPHVDLVVHHGGAGTTLGSAGAGAPQLFLPQGADQFLNADAVVGAGAGAKLVGDRVTAAAVADEAARLMADPTVRESARALAAEIAAMPAPDEVAARLPDLIS